MRSHSFGVARWVVVFLLSAVYLQPASAEEPTVGGEQEQGVAAVPSQEAAARGVEQYEELFTPEGQAVALKAAGGEEIGTLLMEPDGLGGTRFVLKAAGREPISVAFDKERGILIVTDSADGETGIARFDLKLQEWSRDEIFEKIASKRGADLELIAVVISDLDARGRPQPSSDASACQSDTSQEPTPQWFGDVGCQGSKCRGVGVDVTTSSCCEDAFQDASNCCSNGLCWGCCRFLDCDFHCALTRYFCFCGATGISCSHKVF